MFSFKCGRGGHWSKECPKTLMGPDRGYRDRVFGREPYPPPPPPPFLRDSMLGARFTSKESYYEPYYEDERDSFDRRYAPLSSRDLGPPPPSSLRSRDPYLPPPSSLASRSSLSLRGPPTSSFDRSSDYAMFSRRAPTSSSSRFGSSLYEDYSRDYEDRRLSHRGASPPPPRRYAPY